ncbi:hypothetical protein NDU88_007908, partial [Pleurodeles waltl]
TDPLKERVRVHWGPRTFPPGSNRGVCIRARTMTQGNRTRAHLLVLATRDGGVGGGLLRLGDGLLP